MNQRMIQRIKSWSILASMIVFIVVSIILLRYNIDDRVSVVIFCSLAAILFVVLFKLNRFRNRLQNEELRRMSGNRSTVQTQPLTATEEIELFDRAIEHSGKYVWAGMGAILLAGLITWKGFYVDGFYILIGVISLCGFWSGGMLLYRDRLHARIDQSKYKTVVRGVIARKYTIYGEGA